MAANQKIIDALTTLTSKFDDMNSKIDTLQTQNADLMKMIQSKPISKEVLSEQPTSKLELKKAELEAVKNSKKMKPDAKSKKIEKLEEQISKLESKEEPKEEKEKSNLPRIGDKIKDSLKEVFGDLFAETTPKLFKEYVNSMSSDAYKAHNVKVHMENFLQTLSGGGGGGNGPELSSAAALASPLSTGLHPPDGSQSAMQAAALLLQQLLPAGLSC